MKSDIRRLVELLLESTLTITKVARLAGRDRGTISKLRSRIAARGLSAAELEAMTDTQLEDALRRGVPNVSRRVHPNWDELVRYMAENECDITECHQHYIDTYTDQDGLGHLSYSQFAKYMSAHLKRRAPEYRHHHRPGDAMQMDFAGLKPSFFAASGDQTRCSLLVAVLPCSQFYAARVIQSEKRPDVIHGLVGILEGLGGVPRRLVFDNFKAAVDRPRTKKHKARITPEFLAMLDHYGITGDPARAGEPRDKGAVEVAVKLLQRHLQRKLRHRMPSSLAELDEIVQEVVSQINAKKMRVLQTSRADRFMQKEKSALQPLPIHKYEHGNWLVDRKVPVDYHVLYERVAFSVPFRLIGNLVNIKATPKHIEVYHASKLIAVHIRPTDGTERVTDPDHMPEAHKAMHQKDSAPLIARAATYSPMLAAFVAGHLDCHRNPTGTYAMFEKLLKLRKIYGSVIFEQACATAVQRERFSSSALQDILAGIVGGRKRPSPIARSPKPSGNVRGSTYYQEGSEGAA